MYEKLTIQLNISIAISSLEFGDVYPDIFGKQKTPFFGIIDFSKQRTEKFLYNGDLTFEAISKFFTDFRNSKAPRFYKSQKPITTLLPSVPTYSSSELQEVISAGGTITVGVFYQDDECLYAFYKFAEKDRSGHKYGTFFIVFQ